MKNSQIRRRNWFAVALLLVALGGCSMEEISEEMAGIPLPADKKNYVGKWTNTTITLEISLEGDVKYKKEEGSRKTTINGPIKEFDKDNFVVGFWFMTSTFEVQKTPFQEGERWAMVVNGTKLYKVDRPVASPKTLTPISY
jgi:hypothetical protein